MQVQINKQENEYSDKRSKNNTNWQRKACKRTWLMHLNLGWVSETSFMKEKKEKKKKKKKKKFYYFLRTVL